MGGGHKNDQIKCKNYDVEIEYEGKDFTVKLSLNASILMTKYFVDNCETAFFIKVT